MGRFKRVRRWSVYAATLVTISLIPISYWLNPFVYFITQSDRNNMSSFFLLDPCEGVWMSSWGSYRGAKQGAPTVRGLYFLNKNEAVPSAWYAFPRLQAGYLKVPLVWPSIGLMTLSIIMWKRSRQANGCCTQCGYALEGLPTNTYPECGVEHG